MTKIAKILATRGHVLRSGSASGADQAFENGHVQINENLECYIPWSGFVSTVKVYHKMVNDPGVAHTAQHVAEQIHPAWNRCSSGAKLLHTRNVYQVLGADLVTPSSFLLCWTAGGKPEGGTRTSIILAKRNAVPVFNLFDFETFSELDILRLVRQNISGIL